MCLEDDRVFGKDIGQIVEKPCWRDLCGNVQGHYAATQSCSSHNASENCGKIDNYFKKCMIQKWLNKNQENWLALQLLYELDQ